MDNSIKAFEIGNGHLYGSAQLPDVVSRILCHRSVL